MATNENLQQINTFTGGMNSDVSDALLKNDQYRLARNLRLSTETDENEGELHVMLGLKHKWTIQDSTEVVSFTSCRQYIITVYKTTAGWCIGVIDTTNNNGNKCIFGPCKEELGEHLSLVTKYESDENVKLYIADGLHNILSINIYKEYKKLLSDIRKDIYYLCSYANTLLDKPIVSINTGQSEDGIGGHIIGGKVQYAYTLYTEGMGETTLSPLSDLISIYKESSTSTGCVPGEVSTCAVDIIIPDPQVSALSKLKIYRINYVQGGLEPTISLIYDDKLVNTSIQDVGDDIEEIAMSEFLALLTADVKPKFIEDKDNYLFAGNVEYSLDEIDKEIDAVLKNSSILKDKNFILGERYIENTFGDVVENTINNYKPSLMPGDVYKYGIIFYDKNGKKSSVYDLTGQIMVPEDESEYTNNEKSIEYHLNNNVEVYSDMYYKMRPTGIRFKLDTSKLKDKFSAFEIVRCENTFLNRRVLAHGITGFTHESKGLHWPANYLTREKIYDHWRVDESASINSSIALFACPEYCYNKNNFQDLIKTYDRSLYLKWNCEYKPAYGIFDIKHDSYDTDNYYMTSAPDDEHTNLNVDWYKNTTRLGTCRVASVRTEDEQQPGDLLYGAAIFRNGDNNSGGPFYMGTYKIGKATRRVLYHSNNADASINNLHLEHTSALYAAYIPCTYKKEDYQNTQKVPTTIKIDTIEYATSPEWSSFMDENANITVANKDMYAMYNGKRFINWCIPVIFWNGNVSTESVNNWKDTDSGSWQYANSDDSKGAGVKWPDVSSGGRYLVLSTDKYGDEYLYEKLTEDDCVISTSLLCKQDGQYGYKDKNCPYLSHGTYEKINDRDEIVIDVFDGDAYLNMFNFLYLHAVESARIHPSSTPVVYAVPIYSRIDLHGKGSLIYPQAQGPSLPFFQDEPAVLRYYTLALSAYLYNLAYSLDSTVMSYYETLYHEISTNKFDCRVVVSEQKENGELIDNWLKFRSANFLDVNTEYGQITNLRSFKNSLLYWQTDAFGKLSVNERQLLQGANDSQIILGTGGVLDRFDYITTKYGMAMNEQVDSQSSTALYWWDSNRRKVLGYSEGNAPVVLQDVANMINYVNDTTNKINPCITHNVGTNDVVFNLFKTNPVVYNERMRRFISEWQVSYKYSTTVLGVVYYANGNGIYTDDGVALRPYLKYVVNKMSTYNKAFDNTVLGGRIYGGGDLQAITFKFTTPLKQEGEIQLKSDNITNREYDFRFAIPRNNNSAYGDRLRGKTMLGELSIKDVDFNPTKDFSLQYIITKYRVSWT